jgi:hypothetical protein
MMCDKYILLLFFEDLNQAMPPLYISYYYISSVTVSCTIRHQYVQAVCFQDMFCLDILTFEDGPIGSTKTYEQNYQSMLRINPQESMPQNLKFL